MNLSELTTSMKAYFDRVKAKFAETLSAANSHADTKAAQALSSANSYANARASDAQTNANNYTDNRINNHSHDDRYYTKSQTDSRIAANSGNRVRYVNSNTLEIEVGTRWYEVSIRSSPDPGNGGGEA